MMDKNNKKKSKEDSTNDVVVMFEGTIYESGYGWVAQKVMRDKKIHSTAKAIYAYICSMAGNPKDLDGRKAFPSVSLMKAELGINSDGTFYKYMKQLKQNGYLKVEQEKNLEGKFKRNIYKIVAVPKPIEEPEIQENNRTPKNEVREKPHSNLPSTAEPSTEKRSTNSNSFSSNSFNKDIKRDTYKDTEMDQDSIFKEQDNLLKESLKDWIPPLTHKTLTIFSKDYDEMYHWFGIILRAKKEIEDKKNMIIELEQIDYELNQSVISGIRAIKTNNKIKSTDNYLYITILNGLDKITLEIYDEE